MKKQFIIVEENHPHIGETCELTVSKEGTVSVHTIFGRKKCKVTLVNCRHGVDECFVNPNGLMEID